MIVVGRVVFGRDRRLLSQLLDAARVHQRLLASEPAHSVRHALLGTGCRARRDFAPPDPATGRLEDFPVDDQDDCEWHVKSGACGEYLVRHVLTDEAFLLVVDTLQESGVSPAEQRRQRDDQSDGPDEKDHDSYALAVAVVNVIHLSHGPVSRVCMQSTWFIGPL